MDVYLHDGVGNQENKPTDNQLRCQGIIAHDDGHDTGKERFQHQDQPGRGRVRICLPGNLHSLGEEGHPDSQNGQGNQCLDPVNVHQCGALK